VCGRKVEFTVIKVWTTKWPDTFACMAMKMQNYNGLIINNGSQEHNYIYKYNNSPTTCFGLIRPSSGWIQCQRKNYLSDLNAGVQGRGRDLVYKYGVSG